MHQRQGVSQACTQSLWAPCLPPMGSCVGTSNGSASVEITFGSLTVLAVFSIELLSLFCRMWLFQPVRDHCLLTCANVSNIFKYVRNWDFLLVVFLCVCFVFFFFHCRYSFFSTLLFMHLNDLIIVSDLQLAGELVHTAPILILWFSASEDCWAKIGSYLIPLPGSHTSGRRKKWKNTVPSMSWLLCLFLSLPRLWHFSFRIWVPRSP